MSPSGVLPRIDEYANAQSPGHPIGADASLVRRPTAWSEARSDDEPVDLARLVVLETLPPAESTRNAYSDST
jgi:hypothetical protein